MKKINKVKFFVVAAAFIGGISNLVAATPAPGENPSITRTEEAYDFGDDPNSEIGVPGTSVVDTALDKPYPASPHDCPNCRAPDSGFEPAGIAKGSKTEKANQ